jgi:high affinity sulfate transporter 1
MTASAVAPLVASDGGDYAAMCAALGVLVGLVCLVGFLLKLGFLANLLSRPILVGYLAGVACIMIVGQLGKVTGIDIEADGFVDELREFVRDFDQTDPTTLALAIGVVLFLFAMQHFFPKLPGPLIAVLASVVVVAVFDLESDGVSVVGEIPAGLPRPRLPDIGLDALKDLAAPAVAIALVGYSDNVLTARAFAARSGTKVDANQELLALGGSNIGAGLFQGFPISSSGSRTTIGDSVGSKTQVFSLFAFLSVLAVLFLLRPLLEQFPDAALGALVIWAALKLVDLPEFRRLLAFRRSEIGLALATTAGVLLTDILVGVVIAIALSVVDLVARIARPHDAVLGRVDGVSGYHDVDDWDGVTTIPGLLIYRYDAPLFFANADDFRDSALLEIERAAEPVEWFVIQAEAIGRIDSSAAQMLEEFYTELTARGIVLGVSEAKFDLTRQLRRAGLVDLIGSSKLFETIDDAVDAFLTRPT